MQIKTTLRYHLSPIRLAKIQRFDNTPIDEAAGNSPSHTLLVGVYVSVTPYGEQFRKIHQSSETHLSFASSISLMEIDVTNGLANE